MKTAAMAMAAFVVVTLFGARGASAAVAPPLPGGLVLRNSSWLSERALALAPLGAGSALTARLELDRGETGGALGLTDLDSALVPGRDHLGLEVKAVRAAGAPGAPTATYVGPQVSYGTWSKHVSVGWLFDVENEGNNHPQVGIGLGF